MKYLLFVKGDGRGHLTQALSLSQLLLSRGHEVTGLVIGAPPEALLPTFIFERASSPVTRLSSPVFLLNRQANRIDVPKSIWVGLGRLKEYRQSLKQIDTLLAEMRPDVLINLYEPLLPLYYLTRSAKRKALPPVISISHQALMHHPGFVFPPGASRVGRATVVNYTHLINYKATKTLALSFYELPDSPSQVIFTVSPLLREEVLQREATTGNHLLMYMVYHGISEQIIAYNKQNPAIEIQAFWSKKDVPDTLQVSDTLTFHQINDTLFLDYLASARGVATTAGFETVCEAFYYRKPTLLMPMPGQWEQIANAYDAEKVGAGRKADALDPKALQEYIPEYAPQHENYLRWLATGRVKLIYHLENPTALTTPQHLLETQTNVPIPQF